MYYYLYIGYLLWKYKYVLEYTYSAVYYTRIAVSCTSYIFKPKPVQKIEENWEEINIPNDEFSKAITVLEKI
jgi:hypothetical protein